jgi:hypothetical protein
MAKALAWGNAALRANGTLEKTLQNIVGDYSKVLLTFICHMPGLLPCTNTFG